MADDAAGENARAGMSEAEWQARVDLAALYRLVALEGWDDLIFTHISMRVPGPEHHFLINPYGLLFEEITASSLVKVDLDGQIVVPGPYIVNPAGFTIHSAVHQAREDAHCVMHLHTSDGVAASVMAGGLLPLSQTGMIARSDIAYHDYEGVALNHDERERIVADLGQSGAMLLRNHGTLTVGRSAAEAWTRMHFLERACAIQVRALAGGRENVLLCTDDVQGVVSSQSQPNVLKFLSDSLIWPAMMRKLDRVCPDFRT
jgi:ribulose-5-phosphate 4-epimerase/fuculose-1-phosphate aldolase